MPKTWETSDGAITKWTLPNGQTIEHVHNATQCWNDDACVIHNPSNHRMRDWPLYWNDHSHRMERVCEHDYEHPDPDDIAFHLAQGRTHMTTHECDGCCQ